MKNFKKSFGQIAREFKSICVDRVVLDIKNNSAIGYLGSEKFFLAPLDSDSPSVVNNGTRVPEEYKDEVKVVTPTK